METIKSTISRYEEKAFLQIHFTEKEIMIDLTSDDSISLKNSFNDLIVRLKNGKFQIELVDSQEDLYYHVCKEYLRQLNSEISNIYGQMRTYGIVKDE
ncbi:hypothetical protein EHQ68_14270 [Leptospira congkakensis]|uniref:Uncharacterized protein n=1 Tax=Leptospira congkakensis TaxID=2484932 RepID=A0A4Z1AE91_9LEPT|nr:hypothetical protein [Leptospira congkakensis]TGL86482.1 hypothetical protein EHQ68_14270 [Leptospira congkakensis]TGL93972.1 hypothetical protein EHQ69_05760 [Leptospira congkakensis]TGL94622.1 hypothetical protein EHQ70_15035 [Leptospira congkakensis]